MQTMRYWAVLVVLAITSISVVGWSATKGDNPPKARSGAVQVAGWDGGGLLSADGGVAPTKVFTGLPGRNAFAIYNNGTTTIWCGFTTLVSPNNGFPVAAGATLSVDLVWNAAGDQDFYCTGNAAVRDQDAPADTRWIQVK